MKNNILSPTPIEEEIIWDITDKLNYILQFSSRRENIFLMEVEDKKRFVVRMGLNELPIKLRDQFIEWDGTSEQLQKLHKFVSDYHDQTVQDRKF